MIQNILKDERFFEELRKYFMEYLPNYKSAIPHTMRAYKTAIDRYLTFLKEEHGVTLFDISFSMITAETLQKYLVYLQENGASDSTCRHRMACLKSFLKYCS